MARKEIRIEVDGILGVHEARYRIEPKEVKVNGQTIQGWDMWREVEGKWVKQTRNSSHGNRYLKGETLEDSISNLLTCGDYCFSKKLISVTEV